MSNPIQPSASLFISQKRDMLQKTTIDKIVDNSSNPNGILMIESPTGSGKSKILLDSANKILKETNKSVIISTATNQLCFDLINKPKAAAMNSCVENTKVMIGISNYVNKEYILSNSFIELLNENEIKASKEEIQFWLDDKENNHHLCVKFIEDFNLNDNYLDLISIDPDNRPKDCISQADFMKDIEEIPGIYITNHFYILNLYSNNGRRTEEEPTLESFEESLPFFTQVPILFDEVHDLHNTAKNLFKKSFSMFIAKSLLQNLENLKDEMPKSHHSPLRNISFKIKALYLDTKSKYKKQANERIKNPKEVISTLKALTLSKEYDVFLKNLAKLKTKKYNTDLKTLASKTRAIFRELDTILFKNEDQTILEFSPTNHYPTITKPILKVAFAVQNRFWLRNRSFVAGLSGTLKTSKLNNLKENLWSFERIGLLKIKTAPKFNIEPTNFIQNRIEQNLEFYVNNQIFNKNQATQKLLTDERFRYPNYNDDIVNTEKLIKVWTKNHADGIKSELTNDPSLNSALILMNSYETAKQVQEQLNSFESLKDYEILCVSREVNTQKILMKHKENISKNKKSILIGNSTFFTGIDLAGKYIDLLYMAKLPFAKNELLFTRVRINYHGANYDNKMTALLTFRQGIGRAIRSENDTCKIVIGDPRLKNLKEFQHFLDKIAQSV